MVGDYKILADERIAETGYEANGCSTLLKTYVHRWFRNAKLGCIAHDAGAEGLLKPYINPGWGNDLNWFSYNWHEGSKLWAVISLPGVMWYSLFKFHIGVKFLTPEMFWALNLSAMVTGVSWVIAFKGLVVGFSYLLHELMVFRRLSLLFGLVLTWDAWTWVKDNVPPENMDS